MAAITAVVGLVTCIFLAFSGWNDAALFVGILFLAAFFGVMFGVTTHRTMFYIPSFVSGVATIILWMQIFNPEQGLINNVLSYIVPATTELPKWLSSTKSLLGFLPLPAHFNSSGFGLGAREAIMIMGFGMGIGGNNMILYIASISNIPDSLYEAAEIDGANWLHIYLDIILPLTKPGLITLAIFTFIGNYRNLMWPLITIKDTALKTVPVGLLSFQGSYHSQTELLMAATMICIIPLIIMFIVMQKQLVRGINLSGGVKE